MDVGDAFCSVCGGAQSGAQLKPSRPSWTESFSCPNCGAESKIDPSERSYTCAYCGSSSVLDRPGWRAFQQEPEFVLPFAVTPAEAKKLVANFLKGRWFVPEAVRKAIENGELVGKYLPFWHFAVSANSTWFAEIGEYWYRRESYTVVVGGRKQVRTRQVRKVEWWPLHGKFHRFWRGYLVPASESLTQAEVDLAGPFWLEGLKRYRADFLAGWQAENATVAREDALALAEELFRRWQREAILDFLPGDTYRNFKVDTALEHLETDLVLVPFYICPYRWGKRQLRIVINGQTGKVSGAIPRDWKQIVATVLVVMAVLTLLALLMRFLSSAPL